MLLSVSKNNLAFSLTATLVYFILGLVGILHHEIWLDEAHSFLIARDSLSLNDLLSNTRQEGHPLIWYFLLWFLTRITHEVFYMQLLHILISSTSIFLLFYFAPLNNLKKILFAFSYFFFYEYNIISRNYGIGMLFVTIFCLLICQEKKRYILISLVLALLANTHFIALLLTIPLALTMFILLRNDEKKVQDKKIWILSALILTLAFVVCIARVIPPDDSYFKTLPRSAFFSLKRWSSFTTLFKSFYQFPDLWEQSFWNSNLFTSNKIIGLLLSLAFPVLLAKAFLNKPLSLLILFVSAILISLFFFTELMHNYTVRHWGFIFLGFYAALWLDNGVDQKPYADFIKKIIPTIPLGENTSLKNGLVYSALLVQVAASVIIYSKDLRYTFSNAGKVAQYIQQNHYEKDLTILSNFTSGPAVSAYLDKKIYYPEYQGLGSFGLWNTSPWRIGKEEMLRRIASIPDQKRAVLILDSKILNPSAIPDSGAVLTENDRIKIQYLTHFDQAMLGREDYEVYLVSYK